MGGQEPEAISAGNGSAAQTRTTTRERERANDTPVLAITLATDASNVANAYVRRFDQRCENLPAGLTATWLADIALSCCALSNGRISRA